MASRSARRVCVALSTIGTSAELGSSAISRANASITLLISSSGGSEPFRPASKRFSICWSRR